MKKFVLLFAFLGFVSLNVNAQKACAPGAKKACCAKTASATKTAATAVSVDQALTSEVNVQKRVCAKTGTVSYVRKDVCTESGKISFADVEFCTKSGKFVNVSPSEGNGEAMTAKTVAGEGVTKAPAKKGCCAAGAKGAKASCSKTAKASTKNEMAPVKTKLVKAEQK